MVLDKVAHQVLALLIIEYDDLDSSILQILLATHKCLVLSDDDSTNFVKDTSSSTHIARTQRCIHGGTFISGGG